MVIDKRIVKTRNSIKNAFMQMVINNDIHKISVSSLTEYALINRSTFYLHYSDVNEIMQDIENEIERQISCCFAYFDASKITESTFTVFTKLTDALAEKPLLKSYILESTLSKKIIVRLKEIFSETAKRAIIESFPDTDKEKIDYPLCFASSGIIDCYVKWANSNEKGLSLNELINTVSALTKYVFEFIYE